MMRPLSDLLEYALELDTGRYIGYVGYVGAAGCAVHSLLLCVLLELHSESLSMRLLIICTVVLLVCRWCVAGVSLVSLVCCWCRWCADTTKPPPPLSCT